jgi:hypothetical protein
MKFLTIFFTAIMLAGCAGSPCYNATTLRKEAEKELDPVKKANLLGKADAAQNECNRQGEIMREQQKRDAMERKQRGL